MKKPSAETELRNLKRDYRDCQGIARKWESLAQEYRTRATKAEQEVAEWKRRFDVLLERTPKESE